MSISKILLAAAAAVLAQHTEVDEVYVTEDGNAWLPVVKHLATTHARANKLPDPKCVTRKDLAKDELVKEVATDVVKALNDAASQATYVDEAAAAAQAEEAAAAEAAAKDDRDAEERAQDEANLAAAAEAKAADEKAKAAAAKATKPATTKGGKKGK